MLRYATIAELLQRAQQDDSKWAYREASKSVTGKSLFLSHSRADLTLMGSVVKILEGCGASVYVDALDERLPADPSPETADLLKNTIRECPRFVIFVTPNTKDSKWIPWELGIADGVQGASHVALFPASDATELDWAQREYLGLYSRIVWANLANQAPRWLVYNHRRNTAGTLESWINPLRGMFG